LGYNYPSIRAWKDLAVKRTGAGGNKKYYENQGVNTYSGLAHFLSPNEISVNRRHLSAGAFLIATGAHWTIPDITGLSTVKYLTPKTILESIRPPKSLLVIGGDSAAVEITQLMATFGTKVYIVEKGSRLLPRHDIEVGTLIEKILDQQKGVTTLTQSRVVAVVKDGLGKRATISRGGAEKTIRVDEVLVADGRTPNVDLGLANAGVKFSDAGIVVNNNLQTSVKHIFAAGEVLGRSNNTHTALMESQIVANNIFHREKVSPDYSVNPEIVFTYPGIATIGLSEDDCLKRDLPIKKAVAPLSIVARSNTSDFRDGFVKIVTDKKGVILGASVVAPHAGEIIHELALAVKYGLSAYQVADTPHAFLSWSEAVRVAAAKLA
jgi:pyruvate/2-oxoglutarate dehydrogenase complex dihydrolipoamide dehydrogenase (E3) component